MFRIATAAVALMLGIASAQAQSTTTPPATPGSPAPSGSASSGPGNKAVNSPNTTANPGAPVAGANSFTEGQAKARIESLGYSNVTELQKDANGIWRGKGMKDGKSSSVNLDFQGNVTAQ